MIEGIPVEPKEHAYLLLVGDSTTSHDAMASMLYVGDSYTHEHQARELPMQQCTYRDIDVEEVVRARGGIKRVAWIVALKHARLGEARVPFRR